MIPKIIHYCWLSNDPIPAELQKYMKTWEKHLPDYEFMLWNFDRFPKTKSKWVSDAFDNKKYAFAADYIRLYALYHYGGIYLDMDVEVLHSFNPFLNLREMLCMESSGNPEVAAFGVEKHCDWIKICLDKYDNKNFINKDGSFNIEPLPSVINKILKENGYTYKNITNIDTLKQDKMEIVILPTEYFSPKSYETGKLNITDKTISIHHFAGSWLPWYEILEAKIWNFFGLKRHYIMNRIFKS